MKIEKSPIASIQAPRAQSKQISEKTSLASEFATVYGIDQMRLDSRFDHLILLGLWTRSMSPEKSPI
jgi:hypothetical protein